MKRLHLLAAACAALALPLSVEAGTATFGLFPWSHCRSCSPCPRPYNAFSAGPGGWGCGQCGMGHGGCGHGCGGQDCGGHGCQKGCGHGGCRLFHLFHGHKYYDFHGNIRGTLQDGPYQGPRSDNPFPKRMGCGNPFGGCGTRHSLFFHLANWKLKDTEDIGIYAPHWGHAPLFADMKAKFGGFSLGGGHIHGDGVIHSSPLLVQEGSLSVPGCTNCGTSTPPVNHLPAAIQQTGYQQAVPQGYYPPQGWYYYPAPWGYYPAYGYQMGY